MPPREVWVRPLDASLFTQTKRSFAVRRVAEGDMLTLVGGPVRPRSGDVVLATVARLGHHKHIEQPHGRRSMLHVDDLVMVAYADRYATDQFESHVPYTLGPTRLVASGGIASKVLSRTTSTRAATRIVPLGLVGDARGRPLNVADYALPRVPVPLVRPPTICVLGTSMNSGKTTTIHYLVHGMARQGMRPGVTKVTGTGSGNDFWVMLDAGAHRMLDFTDAGPASTFRQPMPVLERAFAQLVSHLTLAGCGINFVEIADGVLQQETARLLRSSVFAELIDAVVLASSDAMGAAFGVQTLRAQGIPVVAVSGIITKSSLASREAEAATGLPTLSLAQLTDPEVVAPLLNLDLSTASPAAPAWPGPAWPIDMEGLDDDLDTDFDELVDGLVDSDRFRLQEAL